MPSEPSGETGSGVVDFERFFELAADVMVVTRPDGRFERVNPAMERLLGVPAQVILANPWTEFVHPDDREPSTDENVREFGQEDHRTLSFENRYVDRAGDVHWMEWNAELDPETGFVYGIARDVTERKAAHVHLETARAAAEEANAAKDVFLSRMSHELRTPLNAILGFGQALELEKLDASQHRSVQEIVQAGRNLLELIDELLELTTSPEPTARPSIAPPDVGGGGGVETKDVLYIEDSAVNVRVLERWLEQRPAIRLRTAVLGEVGLEMAKAQRPDLIALDLQLPDIPGETVLERLRGDRATADIPVVILSADATRRQIDHLLALGAAEYLTKPLDMEHLLQVVDRYLDQ